MVDPIIIKYHCSLTEIYKTAIHGALWKVYICFNCYYDDDELKTFIKDLMEEKVNFLNPKHPDLTANV